MLKGFTRKFKPLELMTEEEVEAIHRGALFILEKTGMRIEHAGALKLLADHGCSIGPEGHRVRFPASLVEDCLRSCPSHYLLRARDRGRDVMVGGNTVYFMQGMGMRYVDLDSWETRPATAEEHRQAMIVADALDNLHLVDGWEIYTERQDVPPIMTLLENLASGIRYSSKAQVAGNIKDTEIFAIKMAQALGIDLNPEIENASPLTIQPGGIEAAFRYIEAENPITPALGVGMGTTGPATMAGAVTQQVAEMMGWVVIMQLHKRGAALSIHHGGLPVDMRRGYTVAATPAEGVTTVLMNQMLRKYQIPIWSNAGWASASKKIDYQAGFEKATGQLVGALSGGNLLLFQGGSSDELLYHPVLAIMDDDIAGWIGHFLEGATINDETLALDVINLVGPLPGHFLGTAHTRAWWKKEHYFPLVTDKEPYAAWLQSGKKDMLVHAKEKMDEILASHKVKPLTANEEQAIEDVLKEARDYFRRRGDL